MSELVGGGMELVFRGMRGRELGHVGSQESEELVQLVQLPLPPAVGVQTSSAVPTDTRVPLAGGAWSIRQQARRRERG